MDKKKAIWITGANAGIGKALSLKFNTNNYFVLGSARRKEKFLEIQRSLKYPEKYDYFVNDVSNSKETSDLIKKIQNDFFVDCLINNAGITSFKPFIDNSLEEIDSIIKTNLNGAIYTIRSVLPKMMENNSGTIINILSVAAKKIFTNSSVYAASKAGLEVFSKVVREEVRQHNVKIINIFPGATATEIWPEKTIDEYSSKMMNAADLAELIFDIYKNSSALSPEEIVVRPISGDL